MEVSGHCHNMAILPLGKESSVTIVQGPPVKPLGFKSSSA